MAAINSRDTRFDVVAKAAPDTDVDAARRMLRSLLADRLKLAVRTEQRAYSFLALVPARTGASLSEALEDQLGLRLERSRDPLDIVVVEAAAQVPTDNEQSPARREPPPYAPPRSDTQLWSRSIG